MGLRRSLTWGLVLLGIVALGLVAPAAGVAKKKHKKAVKISIVQASGTTGAVGTITTVTATCPGKTRVVGGGFSTVPYSTSPSPLPRPLVFESRRATNTQWRVSAREFGIAGSPVNATAFCEKNGKGITEVSQAGSLAPPPNNAVTTTQATCPGKLQAVSGGFLVTPPTQAGEGGIPVQSERVGTKSWQVGAFKNTNSASAAPFTSYAYCANEKRKLATATGTPAAAIGTQGSITSPACRKKTRLAAVGFNDPINFGSPSSGFIMFESGPASAKSSRASGVEVGTTTSGASLTSDAYCA
jgi:hypothetical protein